MDDDEAAVLRRRFLQVGGRAVHCLRLGSGPPAVLVHSSPLNAWYVLPQMRVLAATNTCWAFDSPGFGLSDPLPGQTLTVADLARALAENMAAAGLPPCPVYGTHTGAAIALALGAHYPERVTALALDGVPLFTPGELAALFDGYFKPLQPDALGGHYSATWTRFRDQYVWFPWTHKTPEHHNETDLGNTEALQAWMMSFFHCGTTYVPAYRAAVFSQAAADDVRRLACPAVFMASETDMLHPHLARLPALRPEQAIRDIGRDKDRKDAAMREVIQRWPAAAPAPASAAETAAAGGLAPGPLPQRQFIDVGAGQVLLRHAGPHGAPPLLLLHDAPGSGQRCEALMQELAQHHRVLLPDLPGCGDSPPLPAAAAFAADAPAGTVPPLAAWADALAAVCSAVGVDRAIVYGIGTGAALALAYAQAHPARVQALVLRGLPWPSPEEREQLLQRYAPPIVLQPDGSHWYRTWLMLRDQQVWFPWYDTRAVRLRRQPPTLDAQALHDHTFEVMKQHASYHQLVQAALAHDSAATLAAVATSGLPWALCNDPQQPFFAHDAALRAAWPQALLLPPHVPARDLAALLARASGAGTS